MKKQEDKKRKKPDSDQSKESKKQKYTKRSTEKCKDKQQKDTEKCKDKQQKDETTKEQDITTEKESRNKTQKKWCACLDREFIDIVVKLGGAQAATPKKILQHMKEDNITLLEIKSNLKRTKAVDNFVKTKQQPTFVDTQDWTQQMLYYFKERWEKAETYKRQTTDHIAGQKIGNVISDKCKATKKQKYTTWSKEMCKKFIDILFKLGGSQDATPYKIIQYMKDDNVTVSEVQNHLKVSWENLHGSENTTPAEYKAISKVYMDIGDQIQTCHACKAKLWTGETNKKQISKKSSFSMCCKKGLVLLPKMEDPPKDLLDLFTANDATSKYFIHHIRMFNSIFSFTSIGGKVDKTVNNGHGPWIYRMEGENYHLMPSLGPKNKDIPKFSQLYIFDNQNEIQNRFTALSSSSKKTATKVDKQDLLIADKIKKILDDNNPLVKKFRMIGERIKENNVCNVKLRLVEKRDKDGREYNLPTANEVAAIIIGDFDDTGRTRDIIVEGTSGKPQRISELHPSYLPLQYPLLFPYAEDGYRDKIFLKGKIIETKKGRWRLSMREWFAYRMQQRDNETSLILKSHRLYQQFIVDAFTMVENDRLSFIRRNQKVLRIAPIKNLNKSLEAGNTDASKNGNPIVLPSTYTGGTRYKMQNYLDAMALCKAFGYPDLFITFTCNPKWPEINRFVQKHNVSAEDRPDVLTRVFKQKLDQLIHCLRKKHILGVVNAVVYTVEFQKRGLPHAHICMFFAKESKIPNPEDIDRLISAEIPDEQQDPELYKLVSEQMMHGPCGPHNMSSTCMKKKTTLFTEIRQHLTVVKNGIHLDNRYVVPYNPLLMKKFQAHINVEWCNQHVKQRGDYTSFLYTINTLRFKEINKTDTLAQTLTYVEFPKYFVWNKKTRKWTRRKKGSAVGRINYVPRSIGEAFFLRILLNQKKGPRGYEHLKTHNKKEYATFQDTCYAMGLLENDKEYIESIKEAHKCNTGDYCRTLFVMLITENALSRPAHVWEQTCNELSEDIESLRRRELNMPTLVKIDQQLKSRGRSLKDIQGMPQAGYKNREDWSNVLIQEELNFKKNEMEAEHATLYSKMTDEQRGVYNTIMEAIDLGKGGVFFLPLAALLRKTKLIIWDEAPMTHKHAFEALDRTLREVIDTDSSDKPFGGKTILFGGDFRQVLPVIQKGTREQIVDASLNHSYIWEHCTVLKLTTNMRLKSTNNEEDTKEIKEFADWMLKIGEGEVGPENDGEVEIEFPDDVLIKTDGDTLKAMVEAIYPTIDEEIGKDEYFENKAILVPTNEEVDVINEHMLSQINEEEKVYLSSDTICQTEINGCYDESIYSPELLNAFKISGLPNHCLKLKKGVPVMILRNIDQQNGLCNGTRLIITCLEDHVIEGKIISGTNLGKYTYIPRLQLMPSDKRIPFKFNRRQFPLMVDEKMRLEHDEKDRRLKRLDEKGAEQQKINATRILARNL
ncbi:putative PIF1 DNA helicase/replication protein A1-like protein [Tanacetum coccineum]